MTAYVTATTLLPDLTGPGSNCALVCPVDGTLTSIRGVTQGTASVSESLSMTVAHGGSTINTLGFAAASGNGPYYLTGEILGMSEAVTAGDTLAFTSQGAAHHFIKSPTQIVAVFSYST